MNFWEIASAWKSKSFRVQDPQNYNHLPRKTSSSMNHEVVFWGRGVKKRWMNPSFLAPFRAIFSFFKDLYSYYMYTYIYIYMYVCIYIYIYIYICVFMYWNYIKAKKHLETNFWLTVDSKKTFFGLWFCSLGSPTATVFLPKSTSCAFFARGRNPFGKNGKPPREPRTQLRYKTIDVCSSHIM